MRGEYCNYETCPCCKTHHDGTACPTFKEAPMIHDDAESKPNCGEELCDECNPKIDTVRKIVEDHYCDNRSCTNDSFCKECRLLLKDITEALQRAERNGYKKGFEHGKVISLRKLILIVVE